MSKSALYRYCRLLHGWLSAFAFTALCFFSVTGLLLNHPEWSSGAPAKVVKRSYTLTEDEVGQLRNGTEPSRVLVGLAAKRIALKGVLSELDAGGNLVGDEMFVRMQGVRGTSFLRANLRTRVFDVTVETASTLTMLNELHRAERAGKVWQTAVDVIAVALIAISLIGYTIFLTMRGTRLRTALLLTLASTVGMCLIFVFTVS